MLASYVARLGTTWIHSAGAGKVDPLAEVRLPMRVWPVDIDTNLHLNNGRYLTLMDMGRFAHVMRTGLMPALLRNRWSPILGGATVQFRRELRIFQRFELVTRLVAWDEKWFYIEHRFEVGGDLHARGLVRGVIKEGRKTVAPAELLRAAGHEGPSPELPPAFSSWLASQAA